MSLDVFLDFKISLVAPCVNFLLTIALRFVMFILVVISSAPKLCAELKLICKWPGDNSDRIGKIRGSTVTCYAEGV